MVTCHIEIKNPTGLHTRPGNLLVKKAKEYRECTVSMRKGGEVIDCKSLLKVMNSGIFQGDIIELMVDGPKEEAVLSELASFITAFKE